jgi:diaminopimelate epimerase
VLNERIDRPGPGLHLLRRHDRQPALRHPLPEISAEAREALRAGHRGAPLFPRRTNVQFLKVLDRSNIQIEIWERGAGYTLASGSSSSAAAAVARRLGLVDRQVTVHMPGGTIGSRSAKASRSR